jgi:APA family basic amino acid/polyamine antiporter
LPGLAQSAKPIAEAASRFMGTGGSYLITIGTLITMLGTLNVLMLTSSRLLFAMAEQGQLFKQFSYVHQKYHTPWVALWLSALVLIVLTASGSFIHALTLSAIIRLFTFITTCLALPLLRGKAAAPAPFKVKFGVAIAIFSIIICLLLLINITRQEAVDSLIAVLIGVAVYFSYRYIFAIKSSFD